VSDAARQLLQDRAMRDAARALVHSDIAFIRESIEARSLPARLADRVSGGARDIADEAAVVADENRRMLGAGAAMGVIGLALWVFREPLQSGFAHLLAHLGIREKSGEPDPAPARSDSN